ncbi:pre-rRNA-processing protein PNO1, putative [Entamoeba invadens IP1]|uniref:Pre-rRNA-processing protein PNO1, putative n=1 Tax=Entamoeba invadens IP1 TaxID=370355 RepID=A0A0A1TWN7_ENTIV|nr:pre-rRNA-processing protein PNO1, putative [Entamoeba invadens IP1]ELP85602.1 pre-rRNA-processing protein PNO1, putative [Entamoeba invadens IP1]|eukprot:XP_004184948.1 pre-rRNA-processing protein PNO1, putative [Entamoeba invadens IP1]
MSAPPVFPEIKQNGLSAQDEIRSVRVPPFRFKYFKNNWPAIYEPIVKQMKLNIRMNPNAHVIQLKTNPDSCIDAVQKTCDFIEAISKGFEAKDAIALLKMDEVCVDSFEIDNVKRLQGDHLKRAMGRIAGKDGKIKFSIENATHTRIIMMGQKISVMGSQANVKFARDAIQDLILGAPPGKVYNNLKNIASRLDSSI